MAKRLKPPRILSTRPGTCRCNHPVIRVTIATDVPDALPIEIYCCRLCDGAGPWAPQRDLPKDYYP
jgi:hypothetical protein